MRSRVIRAAGLLAAVLAYLEGTAPDRAAWTHAVDAAARRGALAAPALAVHDALPRIRARLDATAPAPAAAPAPAPALPSWITARGAGRVAGETPAGPGHERPARPPPPAPRPATRPLPKQRGPRPPRPHPRARDGQ
ncbi:MAG: hypothetical protein R3F65_06000 [bacterium]